ncbi:conserved protein of unknown function [Shewanella benthica]|uniref:Lipoprotein n=1 Tax=Shewanella benthica TaxID=43661 RepID=A0A330LZA5_9GAMM|nr:hypothetical protein [Shewanella benthica]SQH74433.1 conserved protein of unknown function [Shewanella benthica]
MFRIFFILLIFSMIQGCAFKSYTTKLDTPIERELVKNDYFSSIDSKSHKRLSASTGDELFVMNRFLPSAKEVVSINPPTGNKFPFSSIWSGTYQYNDGNSGDLIVYTTPDYYKGTIGVLLDDNEEIATTHPLVQVEGLKTGRRWKLNASGKFFTIPSTNFDSWALRYGGHNDNKYIFEIVNKHESKNTDVLQTIYVSEEQFRKGFIIRNVLILGLNIDEYGVIKYKISDVLSKNS